MRAGDALGRWSLVVSRRSLVVGKDRIPRRHFVKPKGKDPSTPELVSLSRTSFSAQDDSPDRPGFHIF